MYYYETVLIEKVYNALVYKYNLIDDENRANYLTLFDMSLQLVRTVPIIQVEGGKCWSLFSKCCK